MAEVDFSHAKIAPATSFNGSTTVNPTANSDVSLNPNGYYLYNSNGDSISSAMYPTKLINTAKQMVLQYSGTFTASGTEFYVRTVGSYMAAWRVYNISFSSGDTFIFQIKADLICQ